MPPIVYDILDLLASFLRMIGMAVLGLGIGWLSLDLLRKAQIWQVQVAIFLGLLGLVIAMVDFLAGGALGAFSLAVGVAVFLWGMPKKQKKEDEQK